MKATGIVRRIDDLGRVVVPKEIRRTLRIREGEPLEDRRTILATDAEPDISQVTEDETEIYSEAAATILAEGDAIGMVLLLSRDTERIFGEFEQKMAICGANFLGRQMEP